MNAGAVLTILMLIFGTIGNVISMVVLCRSGFRNLVSAVYLRCLTIVDLIVLYTGLVRKIIFFLLGIDIRLYFPAICGTHMWLTYVSLQCSAWIRIAFTIQRLFCIWLPYGSRYRFTKRAARIKIFIVALFIALLNSHTIYGRVTVFYPLFNSTSCDYVTEDYSIFFEVYWSIIDFCLYSAFPSVFMLIGNMLIIIKVIKSRKGIQRNSSSRTNSSSRNSNFSSMTIILIMLNIFFIIFTSPSGIILITIGNSMEYEDDNLIWRLFDIFDVVSYLDNSLNFVLYCLSGSLFRQEVIKLFCPRRRSIRDVKESHEMHI